MPATCAIPMLMVLANINWLLLKSVRKSGHRKDGHLHTHGPNHRAIRDMWKKQKATRILIIYWDVNGLPCFTTRKSNLVVQNASRGDNNIYSAHDLFDMYEPAAERHMLDGSCTLATNMASVLVRFSNITAWFGTWFGTAATHSNNVPRRL